MNGKNILFVITNDHYIALALLRGCSYDWDGFIIEPV